MHTGLNLIIDTPRTTLTKNYDRDAEQKSLTKPDIQDLESVLREQLQEIIGLILSDPEIENAINNS